MAISRLNRINVDEPFWIQWRQKYDVFRNYLKSILCAKRSTERITQATTIVVWGFVSFSRTFFHAIIFTARISKWDDRKTQATTKFRGIFDDGLNAHNSWLGWPICVCLQWINGSVFAHISQLFIWKNVYFFGPIVITLHRILRTIFIPSIYSVRFASHAFPFAIWFRSNCFFSFLSLSLFRHPKLCQYCGVLSAHIIEKKIQWKSKVRNEPQTIQSIRYTVLLVEINSFLFVWWW